MSSLPTTSRGRRGRDQERGRDRLVPELGGDDEHAEQQGEAGSRRIPIRPGCAAAGRCGGSWCRRTEGRLHALSPPPFPPWLTKIDEDEEPVDDEGDRRRAPTAPPSCAASATPSGRWRSRRQPPGTVERSAVGPDWRGSAASNPWVSAEEDLLEAAPLVDQLVEHDLVLGGERAEPLGRGAVDDQGVRRRSGGRRPGWRRARRRGGRARGCGSACRCWSRPGWPARRGWSGAPVVPCETMTTSSTVSSISERRWEETSTACPIEAWWRMKVRSHWMPWGSSPLDGSSRMRISRVAEQGGGQLESLAHPERELADPAAGDVGEPDQLEGLVHPCERDPGADGHRLQVVARPGATDGSWWPRAPHPRGGSGGRGRRTDARRRWPCPRWSTTSPSRMRRVVVLPEPLGPRKPVTRPAATSKVRSSTARTGPKCLDSPRTSMADGMSDGTPAGRPPGHRPRSGDPARRRSDPA